MNERYVAELVCTKNWVTRCPQVGLSCDHLVPLKMILVPLKVLELEIMVVKHPLHRGKGRKIMKTGFGGLDKWPLHIPFIHAGCGMFIVFGRTCVDESFLVSKTSEKTGGSPNVV